MSQLSLYLNATLRRVIVAFNKSENSNGPIGTGLSEQVFGVYPGTAQLSHMAEYTPAS